MRPTLRKVRCANPASLPCVWDPNRCVTHATKVTPDAIDIVEMQAVARETRNAHPE